MCVGLRTDSIGYAEGGWRVVTSMRSVADLLVSRSCNDTHWHRSVEGTLPPAASLSHLCCRLIPIVLERPALMELAELVAGATIKRRFRSKQTIQGRTGKSHCLVTVCLNHQIQQQTVPDVEEHLIVPDRTEPLKLEEHPVVLERTEPWRLLTEKNPWNALSPEEKEVFDALVHQLHRELGHSDIRGMLDSLRQNRAHPTVLAAAKLMHCTACQESARMSSRPVTSGKVMEPGAVVQMHNFYWKHPLKEVHVKGMLLVDASSRAAVIRIWRTAHRQELLGNVSASEARHMLQELWFKFYGRPETVMTGPDRKMWNGIHNRLKQRGAFVILDKVLDVLKNAVTRAARRVPEDASCEALFDDCTEARNALHRRRGHSLFLLFIGRSPSGLPLDGDKELGEVTASLTSDGRHRLHIRREYYRAYLDEEMSLQQKRREMHKSRPFRVWSSGEWCWFWRLRAHLHRRTKASRQITEGAFLGPARVLLQERERKGDDLKYKAVVWVVDGD